MSPSRTLDNLLKKTGRNATRRRQNKDRVAIDNYERSGSTMEFEEWRAKDAQLRRIESRKRNKEDK